MNVQCTVDGSQKSLKILFSHFQNRINVRKVSLKPIIFYSYFIKLLDTMEDTYLFKFPKFKLIRVLLYILKVLKYIVEKTPIYLKTKQTI